MSFSRTSATSHEPDHTIPDRQIPPGPIRLIRLFGFFLFFFFQIKFIVLKGQSLSYTLRLPVSKRGGASPGRALIKLDQSTRAT